MEQTQGFGRSPRVDMEYKHHMRYFLVECETRPNMRRLKAKGLDRKKIKQWNNYILIVPTSEYLKHDWNELRGYFDQIYSYDVTSDTMTLATDLRILGSLRDVFLDHWMPIRRTKVKHAYQWFTRNKNKAFNQLPEQAAQ